MSKELISYLEMCRREGGGLRRGMHFRRGGDHSVLLTSVQPRAPYRDCFANDGSTLIYEGHDAPQSAAVPRPKMVDQPLQTPHGTPTQNGKFHEGAQAYGRGQRPAERVRVYEKRRQGLWLYHGVFHLVASWQEVDGARRVFKFKLIAAQGAEDDGPLQALPPPPRRSIPRAVKLAVWQRDGGRCIVCGTRQHLQFDHVVPYSKGGTSVVAENIQLLCARHNLSKGARLSAPVDAAPQASALCPGQPDALTPAWRRALGQGEASRPCVGVEPRDAMVERKRCTSQVQIR